MVNFTVPLQVVGLVFGLIMLYITFLYYRKNAYTYSSLALWSIVWILFMIAVLVPQTIKGAIQTLHIARALDFFVITGMFFFAVVVFYLFVVVKRAEKKMERLIDRYAREHPQHPNRKAQR